jgi:hypothetical protein
VSCRSSSFSSALLTLAKKNSGGLTDKQCQSLFHYLQREHKRMSNPSNYDIEDFRQLLRLTKLQVEMDPLTERRKESLRKRLNKVDESVLPDNKTFYAMSRIREKALSAMRAQNIWLNRMSLKSGLGQEEVESLFNGFLNNAESDSDGRRDFFTAENRRTALQSGLVDEPDTIYAMTSLNAHIQKLDFERKLDRPKRIVLQELENKEIIANGLTLEALGWDERNSRLEVAIKNVDGSVDIFSYKNISQETWKKLFTSKQKTTFWWKKIRNEKKFQYSNLLDEQLGGVAPRCQSCGRFADTQHECPIVGEPVSVTRWTSRKRWSRGEDPSSGVQVLLPSIYEFRELVNHGAIQLSGVEERFIARQEDGTPLDGRLTGNVIVYKDENNKLMINMNHISCSCEMFSNLKRCGHLEVYAGAIEHRIDPPTGEGAPARRSAEERLQIQEQKLVEAQKALEQDWSLNEVSFAEAKKTWLKENDYIYSENFELFKADLDEVLRYNEYPYVYENVLFPTYTRENRTPFGIEIEYDFPDEFSEVDVDAANAIIGKTLYKEGLLYSPRRENWHSSHSKEFKDTQYRNWFFEKDGSVSGGEIISPGLYDEKATWENIEYVCKILQENNAVSSKKAGMHVHVSTQHYNGSIKKYSELGRLFTQHEDVIYRLSTNPLNGTHRALAYCVPNHNVPSRGFVNVRDIKNWQNNQRFYGLNYVNVHGNKNDHPEFRLFDASLNPSVIQAQIKLATSMVEAANRISDSGVKTERGKEPVGAHAKRASLRGPRRMTETELEEDSKTTRSFLDTLFTDREDKKHLTWVWGKTRWLQEPTRRPRFIGRGN